MEGGGDVACIRWTVHCDLIALRALVLSSPQARTLKADSTAAHTLLNTLDGRPGNNVGFRIMPEALNPPGDNATAASQVSRHGPVFAPTFTSIATYY